jgi:hypothetical protein
MLYTKQKNHASWQAIEKQSSLSSKKWPEADQITLQITGTSLGLNAEQLPTVPQIIFYPSGQMTRFALQLDKRYVINTDDNGAVNLATINEK